MKAAIIALCCIWQIGCASKQDEAETTSASKSAMNTLSNGDSAHPLSRFVGYNRSIDDGFLGLAWSTEAQRMNLSQPCVLFDGDLKTWRASEAHLVYKGILPLSDFLGVPSANGKASCYFDSSGRLDMISISVKEDYDWTNIAYSKLSELYGDPTPFYDGGSLISCIWFGDSAMVSLYFAPVTKYAEVTVIRKTPQPFEQWIRLYAVLKGMQELQGK